MKRFFYLIVLLPGMSFGQVAQDTATDILDILSKLGSDRVATQQTPIPEPPEYTLNIGVQQIDARMFRIVHELTKNISARVSAIDPQDKGRMDAMYQELLDSVTAVGVAGDPSCTTDFHYLYALGLTNIVEPILPVENEAINSAVAYVYAANVGLRISQSTRRNDCLEATDAEDLVAAINKSKKWLDDFFASHTPMDMPQSHPQRDVVEPTGVR